MAPEVNNSIITLDPLHSSDYVIIHQCEATTCCDFEKISSKQALKISLRDEQRKNEKCRHTINQLSKKYRLSLRQIEYQQSRIRQLSKQLLDTRIQLNCDQEYAVIDGGLDILDDDDDVLFTRKPQLEIILE